MYRTRNADVEGPAKVEVVKLLGWQDDGTFVVNKNISLDKTGQVIPAASNRYIIMRDELGPVPVPDIQKTKEKQLSKLIRRLKIQMTDSTTHQPCLPLMLMLI